MERPEQRHDGSGLLGIWGSDANNVWAVGEYGTILKWNGSAWNTQSGGTRGSWCLGQRHQQRLGRRCERHDPEVER